MPFTILNPRAVYAGYREIRRLREAEIRERIFGGKGPDWYYLAAGQADGIYWEVILNEVVE